MSIASFPLGPLGTNCYVISDQLSAIVVDPGGEASEVIAYINENNLDLKAIVITHLHFDHIYGVAQIQKAFNVEALVPANDVSLLDSESGQGGIWGFPKVEKFEYSLFGESDMSFGSIECNVLATPGHTPGGVSIFFPKKNFVITGDSLFYSSIGRTDLPGGNHTQLMNSIKEKLFTLPHETVMYPGHGEKSTIGHEYNNNPYCGMFV